MFVKSYNSELVQFDIAICQKNSSVNQSRKNRIKVIGKLIAMRNLLANLV